MNQFSRSFVWGTIFHPYINQVKHQDVLVQTAEKKVGKSHGITRNFIKSRKNPMKSDENT